MLFKSKKEEFHSGTPLFIYLNIIKNLWLSYLIISARNDHYLLNAHYGLLNNYITI